MTSILTRNQTSLTYLVSLGVHLLLILLISLPDPNGEASPTADDRGGSVTEIVLPLSEWIESPETKDEEAESEPPAEKRRHYVRTNSSQETLQPAEKTPFISDRHTLAASPEPADPSAALAVPNLEGNDLKGYEVDDREYRDGPLAEESPAPDTAPEGMQGAVMETVVETESETEGEAVKPPNPARATNAFGMEEALPPDPESLPELPPTGDPESRTLAETPTRADREWPPEPANEETLPQESSTLSQRRAESSRPGDPVQASAAAPSTVPLPAKTDSFQPQTRRNKVRGNLSNKGGASLGSEKTTVGAYLKKVNSAVEKRWYRNCARHSNFLYFGSLQVQFDLNRFGKPENPRIVRSDANAVVDDFTLDAILNAEIPAMPSKVRSLLDGELLEITYDVVIY